MKTSRTVLAGLVIAIGAALGITGCTNAQDTGSTDSAVASSETALPPTPATEDFGAADTQANAVPFNELRADAGSLATKPEIITTGNATVETNTPDEAAATFSSSVEELGGRVESTWADTWNGQRAATIEARIPADKYQEALDLLPDLGEVTNQNTNTQDVGLQVADLQGRKHALEASIKRLTELMQEAESTDAVVAAESELTARQSELDGLNSQLTYLQDQVSMSTLSVSFQTRAYGQEDSQGVWDMLLGSLNALWVAFVVAIPWVLVGGFIALIVWLIVKRRRRASVQAKADLTDTAAE